MSPDITMCQDTKCPKRKKCYRFMAKPEQFQSYFSTTPRKNSKCEEYWIASGLDRKEYK